MDTVTTKKTLKVSRGFTYTYYTKSASSTKPTLLLLHGFPDHARLWSSLITDHLAPAGYGVIAPDLLGYDGTSKPTDPAAYKWKSMTADLVEILDAENVSKVVSFGHDWGSRMAQTFYNLAPSRVNGLVICNVAYTPPFPAGFKFSLDGALEMTKKAYGYGLFWYWKFFTAEDAPKMMNANAGKMFDVMHGSDKVWREVLCEEGGARKAIEGSSDEIKAQSYADESMRRDFVDRIARDGFDAPLCWYKATVFGEQDGQQDENVKVVDVPTLYVGFDKDVVCRHESIKADVNKTLLPHLTVKVLEGTHWGLVAKPDVFGTTVVDWLEAEYKEAKL